MKTLFAALAVLALSVSPSSAQRWKELMPASRPGAAAACQRHEPTHAGGTQGYADGLSSGKCYVSIHPMAVGMLYRVYAFFSDGMLMVFNSYGAGEDPVKMPSAREFYFFPRRAAPKLQMDPAAPAVSVTMSDGGLVVFNPADAQIRSVDRGGGSGSPRIDPADRGGVEFSSYNGLMLDVGFRMGELPSGKPENEAVFRSAYGQLCTIKNKELFAYAGGGRSIKYTDQELSTWLKTRCPGLFVDF